MNRVDISVIMSVYNDENHLSEAIESILNQSYTNFEFIIINDGSTDNSLNIINKYKKNDNRVIVLNQENIGLTKSLNKAIKLAKGKYIARMDSDDISHKDRLQIQVDFLDAHQEYALVGVSVIKIDKDSKEIEKNITKHTNEEIKKTLKVGNCIAHGSVMLNKELLGSLLVYDESFKFAQDYQLWTKIASIYKLENLQEYLYCLRLHDKSISKDKVEQQAIYASLVAYEYKENKKILNIEDALYNNDKFKKQVGIQLLRQFKPKLAQKYFSIFSIYFYVAIIFQYMDMNKIKKYFK